MVCEFAHISLENHHAETVAKFDAAIEEWLEILGCYMISGDLAPALLVLASRVRIVGREGRRDIPLSDLYTGDGESDLNLANTPPRAR